MSTIRYLYQLTNMLLHYYAKKKTVQINQLQRMLHSVHPEQIAFMDFLSNYEEMNMVEINTLLNPCRTEFALKYISGEKNVLDAVKPMRTSAKWTLFNN